MIIINNYSYQFDIMEYSSWTSEFRNSILISRLQTTIWKKKVATFWSYLHEPSILLKILKKKKKRKNFLRQFIFPRSDRFQQELFLLLCTFYIIFSFKSVVNQRKDFIFLLASLLLLPPVCDTLYLARAVLHTVTNGYIRYGKDNMQPETF